MLNEDTFAAIQCRGGSCERRRRCHSCLVVRVTFCCDLMGAERLMRTCGGSSGASRMPSADLLLLRHFFLFVAVALLASAPLLSAARHVHKQLRRYKPQVDLRPVPFHNSSGQRPRLRRPSLQVRICIFNALRWLRFNPPRAFKATPHGSVTPQRLSDTLTSLPRTVLSVREPLLDIRTERKPQLVEDGLNEDGSGTFSSRGRVVKGCMRCWWTILLRDVMCNN